MRLILTMADHARRTRQLDQARRHLDQGRLCSEAACLRRAMEAVTLAGVAHEVGLCGAHLVALRPLGRVVRARRLLRGEVLHGPAGLGAPAGPE